jgi:hypothetical protein
METKKWVLMQSMHLGLIRESFSKGTVIEHDTEHRILRIDGRTFDSVKDLEILKNMSERDPANPMVKPYTEQVESDAKQTSVPVQRPAPEVEKIEPLKIIQSDEDMMGDDIDIAYTINKRPEQTKSKDMEVINADEGAAERVARLQKTIPEMDVVRDDDLGVDEGYGSSLNNGQVKEITAKEDAQLKEQARERAESMKTETNASDEVTRSPVLDDRTAEEVLTA